MRTLQKLLTVLDGQQLAAGYLTPSKPTALETAIDLKRQLDAATLNGSAYQSPGNLLFAEAWVASLGAGQDAIFLNDVNGLLDLSHSKQPAYIFSGASGGGGGGVTPVLFNAGYTTQPSTQGAFSGITAVQITTPKAGALQSLTVFCHTAGSSLRLALYSDLSGAAKSLLASSVIGTSFIGVNTLAVTGGPTVPAGKYWIASMSTPAFDGYSESTGGLGMFFSSQPWNAGVFPDPFPAGAGSGPFIFGFYGTFLG